MSPSMNLWPLHLNFREFPERISFLTGWISLDNQQFLKTTQQTYENSIVNKLFNNKLIWFCQDSYQNVLHFFQNRLYLNTSHLAPITVIKQAANMPILKVWWIIVHKGVCIPNEQLEYYSIRKDFCPTINNKPLERQLKILLRKSILNSAAHERQQLSRKANYNLRQQRYQQ